MAETKRTILERIDARLAGVDVKLTDALVQLAEVRQAQGALLQLGQTILQGVNVANQAITDLITQFNQETNDIQARIERLLEAIQTGTVSAEQLAELQAISARLGVLGQDPANPIPTP